MSNGGGSCATSESASLKIPITHPSIVLCTAQICVVVVEYPLRMFNSLQRFVPRGSSDEISYRYPLLGRFADDIAGRTLKMTIDDDNIGRAEWAAHVGYCCIHCNSTTTTRIDTHILQYRLCLFSVHLCSFVVRISFCTLKMATTREWHRANWLINP